MKRILSSLLAVAMMLALAPVAFAARTEPMYGHYYNLSTGIEYGPRYDHLTFTPDVGKAFRLLEATGAVGSEDLDVEEIWCEVNGERTDRVYMEEVDWGDFSTWWFQAGEVMEGELCVLSGKTEYRMPFYVETANATFYDENGHMWTMSEPTDDPFDEVARNAYQSYGVPGTEKTVELRFSGSAWAELETVELSRSNETSGDETVGDVLIALRVNGVMQLTGKSLSGVKLNLNAERHAIIMTMTMPSNQTKYGVALFGYRANREFDLIPGEPPAKLTAPAIPVDPGLSNFKTVNTYTAGQFADVAASYWGAPNIAKAYELGLMKGSSDSAFDPEGSVTVAQTVTMAARLHSIYTTGSENFVQSGVWYQTYVDYCKENGILKKDFADYNAPAKRSDFAAILAAALPEEALNAINTVTSIPDVAEKSENGAAIYALYRAGILTGNDAQGTFGPETSINRAAAAAILTRMADTSLRKSVTLTA